MQDGPVLAFAGIANPRRFYDLLAGLGSTVVETKSFADHHAFGEADALDLLARARSQGARLVTTEKDWVRLLGRTGAIAELAENTRPLPIRLRFEERDEVRLVGLLDGLRGRRSNASAGGL